MLKKNDTTKNALPDEAALQEENAETEDEAMLEDEFDGPINALELENDDFDDWSSELEKIQQLSKPSIAAKPATPFVSPLNISEVAIPPKFMCSLSKQIMTEPVRIAGSKVPVAYEKSVIESYYDEHGKDPMTHEYLDDDVHFIPDLALTREITDFCLAHRATQEKNDTA